MDYQMWIDRASDASKTLNQGSVFVLKDLFQGAEWNALEKGDRLGLGRYFKNAVLENQIPGVTYLGKAKNNSAQYQKL